MLTKLTGVRFKWIALAAVLLSAVLFGILSFSRQYLYLIVPFRADRLGSMQVYFDTGDGFSEQNSIKTTYNKSTTLLNYQFRLRKGEYRAFRLDPNTGPGIFSVGPLRFVDADGQTISEVPVTSLEPALQIHLLNRTDELAQFEVLSGADDPIIAISGVPQNLSSHLPALVSKSALVVAILSFLGFFIVWHVCARVRTNSELVRHGSPQLAFYFASASLLFFWLKIFMATLGQNHDMRAFQSIAFAVLDGENVYTASATYHYGYNYGPVWAYVLAALKSIQNNLLGTDDVATFHLLVTTLVAMADVGIGIFLAFFASLPIAIIFALNPLSVLLSGYHSQFDNVAILFGAIGIYGSQHSDKKRAFLGLLALGFSLITKHIFLFMPLCLLIRAQSRKKLMTLLIPYSMFALAFLPFISMAGGLHSVVQNVFGYRPPPGYDGFFPSLLNEFIPRGILSAAFGWIPYFPAHQVLWLAGIVGFCFVHRHAGILSYTAIYLTVMLVCSPFIADQYLAIPLLAAALFYGTPFMWLYLFFGCAWLLRSSDNVGGIAALYGVNEWITKLGIERNHSVSMLFLWVCTIALGFSRRRLSAKLEM